jgi:hypothetical protein
VGNRHNQQESGCKTREKDRVRKNPFVAPPNFIMAQSLNHDCSFLIKWLLCAGSKKEIRPEAWGGYK